MINDSDMNGVVLYEDEDHSFIWLGADPDAQGSVVQTNQFLLIHKGRGVLFDPGGIHLFSRVVSVASRFISLDRIDSIIFSHQDPDVSSGIALWLGVTQAKVYISGLWIRFLPHFGIVDNNRIVGIEDAGNRISLQGGEELICVPAHFLHSCGNYTVYDKRSRILFTADIGAAVFGQGQQYLFVDDFDAHLKLMEGFHQRYMSGNAACRKWVELLSAYDIEMIVPQHGAVFRGDDVRRFLDWFRDLSCGVDLIGDFYTS